MKIDQFSLCTHRLQCLCAAHLLVFLLVAIIFLPLNAAGQQSAVHKLTLTQVEDLISHHVPDSTMRTEIQRRGLAFAPNLAIVELLRGKGAGPLTLAAIEALDQRATRNTARGKAGGFAAEFTWTDPSTHLIWAPRDNGSDLTWNAANKYCSNLTLGGYTGWHLPSIKELASIYDPAVNLAGTYNGKAIIWHIKGSIHLSGGPWSATTMTSGAMGPSAWIFDFYSGQRCGMYTVYSGGGSFDDPRALCVRGRSGKEIQQQRFEGKPCTAD